MTGVHDLTDGDGADLLTSTGSGGLFGGRTLTDPLTGHLRPDEDVRYVLQNKRGPTVDGDPALAPEADYRAVATVTDLRVLFVAGDPDGDRTRGVAFSALVEAGAESEGLLSSALTLEAGGTSYRFVCRGDVGPVAAYVDTAIGDWGAIERRLDDARAGVETALDAATAGDYTAALDALEAVEPELAGAEKRAADLGPGADAAVEERVGTVRTDHERARRRVLAGRGATAHADGQAAWRDRAYGTAPERYETALDSYRAALAADGPEPTEESLRGRLAAAAREVTVLSAAPVADADTARRRAQAADRAGDAATAWETALERYREALGVDWGGQRRFRVDREAVRDRAAEAAGAAVEAHREAATGWQEAGDDIAGEETDRSAREAYERAREHLDRALGLAEEVCPDAVDDIEADRKTLERRLTGRTGPPKPAVVAAGTERTADTRAGASEADGWAGVALPDEVTPVAGQVSEGATGAPDLPRAAERVRGAADTDAAVAALRDLSAAELRRTVAALWAGRGWETAPADVGGYDVLAVDGEKRRLLWVVDDHELTPAALDRRANARDVLPETAATLVATGDIPPETRERAAEVGVEVVEAADLATSLCEG